MILWSFKGRKLRVILLNILLCTCITLLSTFSVLSPHWTFNVIYNLQNNLDSSITLILQKVNWGSKRLSDLPTVIHRLSGRTGIQTQVFLIPCLSLPLHWGDHQCWQKADLQQCDMTLNVKWHLLMKRRENR